MQLFLQANFLKIKQVIILPLAIIFFIAGCSNGPVEEIEKKIDSFDFAGALDLIEGLDLTWKQNRRILSIQSKSYLVEGKTEEAYKIFSILEDSLNKKTSEKYFSAKILYEAANIIIREKNRVNEAIELLDSVMTRDPSLKKEVTRLAWNSALEYFQVSGDAGYELFRFGLKYDKNLLGRLRGYNQVFSNRYREIRATKEQLEMLFKSLQKYRSSRGKYPANWMELLKYNASIGADTTRKGWSIWFIGTDELEVFADVLDNQPQLIPSGTTLKFP